MAAHDKAAAAAVAAMAAGRAPPPPPQARSHRRLRPRAADVTCKPCKSRARVGVEDNNNEEDAAKAPTRNAQAKGDAASEAATPRTRPRRALEAQAQAADGRRARGAYRAAIEQRRVLPKRLAQG